MFELTEKEIQKISDAYSFAESILKIEPIIEGTRRHKRFAKVTYVKNSRSYSARINLKVSRGAQILPSYLRPIKCIKCEGSKQRRSFSEDQRVSKKPICIACEQIFSRPLLINRECNICTKKFETDNKFVRFCLECRRDGKVYCDEPSRILF